MKLEYKYGQTYFTNLHIGDIVPISDKEYKVIVAEDIDEKGCLKTNTTISTKIHNGSE